MEKHVIGLERHNLDELEVIERLASTIGLEAFESDVQRLAELHAVDPTSTIQSIRIQTHPSLIGMNEAVFQVLQRTCDTLIERDPLLLERLSYRCRNDQYTALPWALWLTLVRHAREYFDPAGADAAFMVTKQREGLSGLEAFKALIALKRSR